MIVQSLVIIKCTVKANISNHICTLCDHRNGHQTNGVSFHAIARHSSVHSVLLEIPDTHDSSNDIFRRNLQ